MRTERAKRLRLMPWVVLVTMLGITAVVVMLRADAVSDGRNAATEAAAGHFRDVVTDNELRGLAVSEAYERVLVGAVVGLESPIDADTVAQRLDELGPDRLPGALAFLVVPTGAVEPTWVRGVAPGRVTVNPDVPVGPGVWAEADHAGHDLVAIGYSTGGGDLVAAIASSSRLLELSGDASGHRHGVEITLAPLDTNGARPIDVQGHSHGAAVMDMAHDDQHGSIGPAVLADNRQVTMFGQPWAIDVVAGEEFLSIPSSREVVTLGGLGVLLSLALFGLIYFLVRILAAESERRAVEERFTAGFNASPVGFAVLDDQGLIVEVNEALERLLDRPGAGLVATPMYDLVAESFQAQWAARVLRHEPTSFRPRAEVCYRPRTDRTVWVDETVTTVVDENGDRHILLQMSDMTEQRLAREELQRRALRDELTGLANRTLLEDRLDQSLLRSHRDGTIAGVMFIDVDQFKMVNDTLGHGAGDQLLKELADRLRSVTRKQDTLARFGGDEFIMLCEGLKNQADAWQIAERIRAQVAGPFQLDGRAIMLTLSIGIALCGPDDDAEALLRDADLAMYQAKDLGRDRAVLFEREMRDDLIQQLTLEDEVVRALEQEQLELYFQPLINIDGGEIIGFEALARWNHPEHGILTPDVFLPVAARLGMLQQIDAWALDSAALQLVKWTEEVPAAANWNVAVNASPGNFGNARYPAVVREALARTGIAPERVTIEITEDAILTNTDTAVSILGELRQLGLRVAIDDFGTGYSSLSQLATLDIDVLKIDKSFLADLQQSPSNEIVRAVVDMAQALGIPTVAEGVETSEDLATLHQMGATQAQGYLISRPVPHEQAKALATGGADVLGSGHTA